jgi:hypothetical protein
MGVLWVVLMPALLLLGAMYYFLQKKDSDELAEIGARNGGAARSNFRDHQRMPGYEKEIFSQRDWEFIRREGGAELEKLFLRERRELAGHWLAETTANIAAIRRHHLQASRMRQDLVVSKELKLLAHFCYLSAMCELLAVGIKVMHPMTPGRLARHVQQLTLNMSRVLEDYGAADASDTPQQASL